MDVNVIVEPAKLAPVFDALRRLGVSFDEGRATPEANDRGMFVAHFGEHRVDFFVPSIPFS